MEEASQAPPPRPKAQLARPGTKGIKQPGKKRRRGGMWRIGVVAVVLAVIGLFVWAEIQRRQAVDQLETTEQQLEEIRTSTQRSGEEVANEVLAKVRAHIDVPQDPAPTVATIVDVERLRQSSEFYNKAENGDHLIITENRAILFDPDRDLIVDVVPVRVNQQNTTPTPEPTANTPAPSPEGTPDGAEINPDPNATPTPTPPF